jgi:thiol-disulfide isomerase/thioredoxin
MTQNIYQVLNETHFDNILRDNMQKLMLVMYSSSMCKPCKMYKPKFVNLSKSNPDVLFIYIDATKYDITQDKHFKMCESFPTFLYYFSNTLVAYVKGADDAAIVDTLTNIKNKIEEKKNQLLLEKKELEEQKFKNPDTELMQKKIFLFNKLTELHNKGVKLTGAYSLDSDYEDLFFEYRYQFDPEFKQHIIQKQQALMQTDSPKIINDVVEEKPVSISPEDQELIKKQQKIEQIKGLSNLEQKMQMISYQKLLQLKKLQQMKEQTEKNQNNL